MRVISGILGGRIFKSPNSFKTHPMSDKVRGALFAMLGDLDGLSVLDAFSGSGAFTIEAISRGARNAVAIEIDRQAQQVIAQNIQDLGITRKVKLIKAGASAWLQTKSADELYDVVLCDPPYNNLQVGLLNRLSSTMKSDGILVLSWPSGHDDPKLDNLTMIERRQYGDAQLFFFRFSN